MFLPQFVSLTLLGRKIFVPDTLTREQFEEIEVDEDDDYNPDEDIDTYEFLNGGD